MITKDSAKFSRGLFDALKDEYQRDPDGRFSSSGSSGDAGPDARTEAATAPLEPKELVRRGVPEPIVKKYGAEKITFTNPPQEKHRMNAYRGDIFGLGCIETFVLMSKVVNGTATEEEKRRQADWNSEDVDKRNAAREGIMRVLRTADNRDFYILEDESGAGEAEIQTVREPGKKTR